MSIFQRNWKKWSRKKDQKKVIEEALIMHFQLFLSLR